MGSATSRAANNIPVFLLPDVARDSRLDRTGMLEALRRKAGSDAGRLFLFEAESIAVRRSDTPVPASSPRDAAATCWLASRRPEASEPVTFARDARTGAATDVGVMHHARSAAVLHALGRHGGHRAATLRGRRRLLLEIQHALAGKEVDGWPASAKSRARSPTRCARVSSSIRDARIRRCARETSRASRGTPGKLVAALGRDAPATLWEVACLEDLDREPWAPWTILGFHAREESADEALGDEGLVERVRRERQTEGAVVVRDVAETAVTALTVEALKAYEEAEGALPAIHRARAFLSRQQLSRATTPAAFAAGEETLGAFVATPTSSALRGDVTAHALLAMLSRDSK